MAEHASVSAPVLSIIFASGAHGPSGAVAAFLTQTVRDIEVLEVVDARADDSVCVSDDERVRRIVCREPTHPRIAGLLESRGRYVMFAEPGDRPTRDYCRALLADARRYQADIAVGKLTHASDGGCVEYSLGNHVSWRDALHGEEIFAALVETGGMLPQWLTLRGKLFSTELCRSILPILRERRDGGIFDHDIAILGLLYAKAKTMRMAEIAGRYCIAHGEAAGLLAGTTSRSPLSLAGGMGEALRFIDGHVPPRPDKQSGHAALRHGVTALIAGMDDRNGDGGALCQAMGGGLDADAGRRLRASAEGVALFRQATGEYRGVLEDTLKPLLLDESVRCVSFDLFDTLVFRPFYAPVDLFRMLNATADPMLRINTPFHSIRVAAEEEARALRKGGAEDVTLDEIYAVMSDLYGIDREKCVAIREEERRLEIRFCHARHAAREVFDLAKHAGKRVVVASDMYLDVATIEKILAGNGYGGRDALFLSSDVGKTKSSGNLFKHMLRELALRPEEVLHIGDNRRSDCEIPQKLGIRTFLFPGAVEAMRLSGGGLGAFRRAMPPTMRKSVIGDSFGYRTGVALAANRYFDDPFRDFAADSDFNADPFFLGYHALGMHLLSIANWVEKTSLARGYRTIHYCARDGYMPLLYHRRLREAGAMATKCDYVYGSRTMVLPGLVSADADFLTFIRPGNTAPGNFLRRFSFCLRDVDVGAALARAGIAMDRVLADRRAVDAFFAFFLTELLDREKLARSRRALARYYEPLTAKDAAFFDVGYNGKTPSAISRSTGKKINVLYIHREDVEDARRMHGFTLDCLYPFIPGVSGPLREHLLSETAPHCVGVEERDGGVHPVFAAEDSPVAEKLVISTVRRGALRFLDDFLGDFGEAPFLFPADGVEMSFPLEGYLHFPRRADIEPFNSSVFENSFDKGDKKANLFMYARESTLRFSPFAPGAGADSPLPGAREAGTLGQYIQSKSKLQKFMIYLVLDRKLLVEILRARAGGSGLVAGWAMRMAAWAISRFPDS